MFTTHLFEIKIPLCETFSFPAISVLGLVLHVAPPPPLLSLIHLICSLSVQLLPFLNISSVYSSFLRKHVSMHRSFIPAYFIVHFENVPVNHTCLRHLLYTEVAQGLVEALAVIHPGVSAALLPRFC